MYVNKALRLRPSYNKKIMKLLLILIFIDYHSFRLIRDKTKKSHLIVSFSLLVKARLLASNLGSTRSSFLELEKKAWVLNLQQRADVCELSLEDL